MTLDPTDNDGSASLIQAATELIPLLDRTILRFRYSQGIPGVSPLEYRILDYVCYHGPARVGEIGTMSGLSFPNASRYVKDLVAKDLLVTSRDPKDGRAQLVSTSERGRGLLDQAEAAVREQAGQILGQLPPQICRELERNVRDLAALLGPLARVMEQTAREDPAGDS